VNGEGSGADESPRTLAGFQRLIERLYGDRDAARGVDGTFLWFVEEVGELARALHRTDSAGTGTAGADAAERANLEEEFADVAAWLVTLASIRGVDLERAAGKYAGGCPRCRAMPCACATK
jgi:NTP pyrophosphatase (non-canonical NTP hydrolase)